MSFNLLEELNITREFYLITPIFVLAKGPAFYLFVQRLIYQKPLIDRSAMLHFTPMLLALPFTQWPQMVIAVGTISQLIYAGLTYSLIKRYHVASYATQSNAFSMSINWILIILAGFLVTEAIDLVRLNAQPYISLETNLLGQLVLSLISFLLVALLAIKLLHQAEIFRGLTEFEQSELADSAGSEANIKQSADKSDISKTLDLEAEQLIFDEVKTVLLEQELYAIPRLSLTDVSKATSFLERDISRAINLIGETNFCEFVNQLRVDSVIKQLPLGDKTILEVSLACGFNSKSSFNAAFKRRTNMTPSQYIKDNR